jgi:molybdopterin/thiamine biosynthesis adenylyltransferase
MDSSTEIMQPILVLREEQMRLLLDRPNTSIEGLAYAMDQNSVLHAYSSEPKVIPSGKAISCFFNIVGSDEQIDVNTQVSSGGTTLMVFCYAKNLKVVAFLLQGEIKSECEVRMIPEKSDLYSRSKGILETDALSGKSVAIVGLGSGGSPIAIELAKAGVSNFVLVDFDRIELSNVSRHICGINDLGRLKTFAVRDAILDKNPFAKIQTLEIDVNKNREDCSKALSNVDLIVCASDNDQSRFLINELALKYKTPALFGRAITRATGGDVLRVRPFEGPCYSCLYSLNIRQEGSDDEEISQKNQAEKLLPDYTNENEIQATIQVGLASDIAPISNFMVKLALVELSKGLESGIKSLEEDLVSDFYIWANRRENIYQTWNKLEFNFNKPSILRWYGAKVERDANCMVCGL